MKNFPHQINDLGKLITGLSVFREVSTMRGSVADDGVVGEELARSGVYSFRDKHLTVDASLIAETSKPESNQGFRTAARDLRRFFELLGFVRSGNTTGLADKVLSTGRDPKDLTVQSAWRDALLNLDLEGSHPYRILIRLAAEAPGREWKMLALCLEPHDDSEPEFQRILSLAKTSTPEKVRTATRTSEAQFRNAMKILPPLGVRLGDIVQNPPGRIGTTSGSPPPLVMPAKASTASPNPSATATGISAPAAAPGPTSPVTAGTPSPAANRHRPVTSATIATAPKDNAGDRGKVTSDLTEAVKARIERLTRHNEVVRAWARLVEPAGYCLKENPFDCLCLSADGGTALLVEAKSLNEPRDSEDERAQVRDALGQLLYYEELELPVGTPRPIKVAAFDRRPSDDHVRLLNRWEISAVWTEGEAFKGDRRAYSVGAIAALLERRFNSVSPADSSVGDPPNGRNSV